MRPKWGCSRSWYRPPAQSNDINSIASSPGPPARGTGCRAGRLSCDEAVPRRAAFPLTAPEQARVTGAGNSPLEVAMTAMSYSISARADRKRAPPAHAPAAQALCPHRVAPRQRSRWPTAPVRPAAPSLSPAAAMITQSARERSDESGGGATRRAGVETDSSVVEKPGKSRIPGRGGERGKAVDRKVGRGTYCFGR